MYWLSLIFIHFSCKSARIGLMTAVPKRLLMTLGICWTRWVSQAIYISWASNYCKIQRSINQQTRWPERARNGIYNLNQQFESINRIRGEYSLQHVVAYSLIVPRCQDSGAPKYSMCFDESILVTIRETHLQDKKHPYLSYFIPLLSSPFIHLQSTFGCQAAWTSASCHISTGSAALGRRSSVTCVYLKKDEHQSTLRYIYSICSYV